MSQVAEIALGNRIVSIVSVLPRRPLTCARPVMPRLTLCPSEWPRMSLRCISLCTTVCGRGPTMLMRPFRTLTKCGSSSSECRRRIRPRRVVRGSFRVACRIELPFCMQVVGAELVDLDFAAVPCRLTARDYVFPAGRGQCRHRVPGPAHATANI